MQPVVVGIDGSPSSIAALDFAAAMAQRRDTSLELIHSYHRFTNDVGMPMPAEFSGTAGQEEIEQTLHAMVERIRQQYPQLPAVRVRQIGANPSTVLIEQSHRALAVVVGCRGVGGFKELLLGSVSAQVSAHAHGPVIVIRPPVADDAVLSGPSAWHKALGPVLACADGSPESALALRFAAEEAVSRGVQLAVAHVYDGDDDEAEKFLYTSVEPLEPIYSGPAIELRPIYSKNPPEALIEASRHAALTVVGSRGRGGFAGLVLGSVSRTLTHYAYSPVAVIHPGADGPSPG